MSVACAGDNVIDVYLPSGQRYPGGNAVNVAVAARRSGVRSAYLGAVGADDAGRRIQDALTAEDVSVSRLRVLPGSTAWCEVQLLDGDREFVGGDLGVSELKLTAEDFAYLADFAVVHTGDNSRLETQLSGLAAVTRVSFDFGDHTSDADYVRALVGQVWCACFSAGHLPAEGATALADEMASLGPSVVLVSEGARGAQLLIHGARFRVASHAGAVTDSLGAGDALIGGVLAGLVGGSSPQDALEAGARLAARVVGHFGAFGYGFDPASQIQPS
jgi:fructoselysine 6-kinase